MNYFIGIISLNLKSHFYFRISAIFSLFSFVVIFLIKSSLWSKIGNISYVQYFAIITLVNSFVQTGTDRYFQKIYQSGQISLLLLRPINFGWHIFLKDFAGALSKFILQSLPLLFIFVLFFDLKLYYGFLNFLFFMLSIFFAYLFNWILAYLIGLSVFYYNNNEGFIQFKNIFLAFFAGALIPFDFFPEIFRNVLYYLPFRVLYQIPIEVLESSVSNSMQLVSIQIIWIIFSLIFVVLLHIKSIKKVEIMGG